MKRILMTLIIGIFLISCVSAFDFDNVKRYDSITKEVTIENAFGLGDDIARVKLDTDLIYLVPRGYNKVAQFTVVGYKDHVNALGQIELYDVKENLREIEREIDFKYLTYESVEVPIYSRECKRLVNKSNSCYQKQIGVKYEDQERWVDIAKLDIQESEIITIGLFTDVQKGDNVEWIPNLFGVRVDEWAVWSASLTVGLQGYWRLNETAGVVVDALGLNNGTNDGATRGATGIIEKAFDLEADDPDKIVLSDFNLGVATFSIWIKPESFPQYAGIWSQNPTASFGLDNGQFGTPRVRLYTGIGAEVTNYPAALNLGAWNHIGWTWNGTDLKLYKDGLNVVNNSAQNNGNIDADASNYTIGYGAVVGTDWFDGIMDEAALWDRALTPGEFTDLWNGGVGITYVAPTPDPDPNTTVYLPVNNTNFTVMNVTFNYTCDDNGLVENITLYINGTTNTTTINGVDNFTNVQYNLSFQDGKREWHIGCWDNATVPQQTNSSLRYFTVDTKPEVYSQYPADDATLLGISNVTLNCSADITNGTLANISVLTNITGALTYTETLDLTGVDPTTYNHSFGIDFPYYGLWNWTCWACSNSYSCNVTEDYGREMNLTNYLWRGENWTNSTYSGNPEYFELNVTIDADVAVDSATLNYNGTNYSGGWKEVSVDTLLNHTITIPNMQSSSYPQNISFHWIVLLDDTTHFITEDYNQTVNILKMDDCTAYAVLFMNYSLRDEEAGTIIPLLHNVTLEVDLNLSSIFDSSIAYNISQNFTNNTNPQICIEQDLGSTQWRLDATNRYDADEYAAELYFIQNQTVINASLPQNIVLYDLKDVDSQTFLITYKDNSFLPVTDALIQIQRKYISEGVSKAVEIPKTDDDGQAVGHFDLDSVIYTITVSKEGTILATFDNIAVVCQDILIGDCRINLNAPSTTIPAEDWEEIGDISYTISLDRPTRTIDVVFTTTDGSSKTLVINTTKYDRFGNLTVCNDSVTSAAGTLTCAIPESFGNLTVLTQLFAGDQQVVATTYSFAPDSGEYFGVAGIIMFLILVITIPLMLTSSPIGIILGIFMGIIMAIMLMLYSGGSVLGLSSALVWAVVAGGIIIWKIAKGA